MSDGLIKSFAVLGALACLGVLIILGMAIGETIKGKFEKRKRAYEYKHRFDKKPCAACYCVDCIHYGQGPYKQSCGLGGVERLMNDNEFCCHAEPRTE